MRVHTQQCLDAEDVVGEVDAADAAGAASAVAMPGARTTRRFCAVGVGAGACQWRFRVQLVRLRGARAAG